MDCVRSAMLCDGSSSSNKTKSVVKLLDGLDLLHSIPFF